MSYRKIGTCEKCGKEFGWSMGHPPEWNEWALEPKDMAPSQRWWFSFGTLCPVCAPSFDEWLQEQAVSEGKTTTLWIVGKVWPHHCEVRGIFDDKQTAIDTCEDEHWFIGPVEMNKKIPVWRMIGSKPYFPLIEKEK